MLRYFFAPFLRIYPASNHATYLRGVAALGVLLIHYDGLGISSFFIENSRNDIILTKIVDIGGQGPTVFFIASGYVLYGSFQKAPSILRFMFIRYFRLMPLYLVISFFAALNQKMIPDFYTVISKLFFLDIFSKKAYEFSPINIGFFVVIEFWLSLTLIFSFLIPRLYLKKYQGIYHLVLVGISFMCHYIAIQLFGSGMITRSNFDIFRFQFWFILGSVLSAYKLKITLKPLWGIASVLLIGLSFSTDNYLGYFVGLSAVAFLLSELNMSVNYPLIFIGNICYSIYLLHQPMLYFFSNYYHLNSKLVAVIVVLSSTLTFRFIEVPFVNLSKKFMTKR